MVRSIINVDSGKLSARTVAQEFRSGRMQYCLDVGRASAPESVSSHPDIKVLVLGEDVLVRRLGPNAILQNSSAPTLRSTELEDEDDDEYEDEALHEASDSKT